MQLLCLMKALSCQSDSYSHRAIFVVIACKHAQIIQHIQGFWSLSAPHCFQMTIEQIKRSLSLCTYLQYDVHNPWHVSMRVSLFQHRTPCWPVGRCSGIPAFTAGVNILSFSCLMLWLSGWWLFPNTSKSSFGPVLADFILSFFFLCWQDYNVCLQVFNTTLCHNSSHKKIPSAFP